MSSIEIDLKDTDRNFLINLQKELLTQTTDGNADPRYWGVKVKKRIYGDVSYFRDIYEVVDEAVFLTKKACMEHIKKNAHNYNDPHTYVMTAFRCPEYERLLKILKETDWAAETTPRIVTNVNSTGKNSIFIDHVNKLEI